MEKTCTKCNQIKSIKDFTRRKSSKDNYHSRCKTCTRKDTQQHYKQNKSYYLAKNKRQKAKLCSWFKNYKVTLKCNQCDESHISCLSFHHIDPSKKEINVATAVARTWSKEKIISEIEKCIILCENCHRKLHWQDT
jgi:hypothetical protein